MKKENNVGYVLRLSLTLLIIAAVVAAILAGVNALTKDIIAQHTLEKTQAAIKEVFGVADSVELTYTEVPLTGDDSTVTCVYKSEYGYAIQVAPTGFDGEITMMVGIGTDGTVLGISIIDQSETAGLGAVCAATTEAGAKFRNQFIGKSGTLAVTKDGGDIDAITSATITSRAVTSGVNDALAWVEKNG